MKYTGVWTGKTARWGPHRRSKRIVHRPWKGQIHRDADQIHRSRNQNGRGGIVYAKGPVSAADPTLLKREEKRADSWGGSEGAAEHVEHGQEGGLERS